MSKDICTEATSGAYEQAREKNKQLKELLKECKEIWIEYHLSDASEPDAVDIITRIDAAIGESEE